MSMLVTGRRFATVADYCNCRCRSRTSATNTTSRSVAETTRCHLCLSVPRSRSQRQNDVLYADFLYDGCTSRQKVSCPRMRQADVSQSSHHATSQCHVNNKPSTVCLFTRLKQHILDTNYCVVRNWRLRFLSCAVDLYAEKLNKLTLLN